jgi:hypothetical protein
MLLFVILVNIGHQMLTEKYIEPSETGDESKETKPMQSFIGFVCLIYY